MNEAILSIDTGGGDPLAAQRVDACGKLALRRGRGTRAVAALHQRGAARIRLPSADHGEPEAVLMNTAGGLTGGDRLRWDIRLERAATGVVTTAAAEKCYRSTGAAATVDVRLTLGGGSTLDWLPQESILFDGSRLRRRVEIDLAAGARLLAVDAFLFGRRAMGEIPATLSLDDRWTVRRGGAPIHIERTRFDGAFGGIAPRQSILHGLGAVATLLQFGAETIDRVRARVAQVEQRLTAIDATRSERGTGMVHWGVSALPGRLVVRMAAEEGLTLRRYLLPCIELLSVRDTAGLPRVWQV